MPTTTGQQIGFVIGIILALVVVVFGVMYGVTGKIPFISEPRRKTFRRKSYRRENSVRSNDGGQTWSGRIGQDGPDIISNDGGQTWFGANGADIRSTDGGITWFGQRGIRPDGVDWWDNASSIPEYQGIVSGELGGYIDQERAEGSELSGYGGLTQLRPPNPFADPRKSGRVAAKLLKSGCSECYRTISQFAQGVGEEYPVSYTDMYN